MTIDSKPIAAIVGAGRTKFGELWYDDPEKLLFDAGLHCMQSVDKGIHRSQLQACFFGSFLYQMAPPSTTPASASEAATTTRFLLEALRK
ncbi:MAG: hypothetical protein NTV15_07650 [Candidatus Bathyarchaeota archaeon]|nr:hypothetical protein [Candidatus Bathyarchaeota archaeon]